MTDQNQVLLDQVEIHISGAEISAELYGKLTEVIVDSSLYVPDMFSIKFVDTAVTIADNSAFDLGKEVEIKFADHNTHSIQSVIKGEITSLEPEFESGTGSGVTMTVRGYDKAHRMYRASKTKAWKQASDADILSQIASANGLSQQADPAPSIVHDFIFQTSQSDFEFLRARADRIGYEVLCQDGKLTLRNQKAPSSADVTLKWGQDLISFTPRVSLVDQVDTVSVRDWDSKQKKKVVGQASSSDVQPAIGLGKSGGQAARSAISEAKKVSVRMPVKNQSEAQDIAKAMLNQNNAVFIEAEGEALVSPAMRAGKVVDIQDIGTKFSGKYQLSTVRHSYAPGAHTKTFFTVEGPKPKPLGGMMGGSSSGPVTSNGRIWPGVVTALVTNVDDPDDMGRVKVKYDWLDDSENESWWARVVIPGGAVNRGIHFTPEVNDEVLVVFENGDFSRPYVLGGLFNQTDTPAVPKSDLKVSEKIKTRVIKTRAGHVIKFTDEDSGQDNKIEIIDAKQKNKIILDCKGGSEQITIDSQGKILIHSAQDMDIKSDAKINIEATSDLSLKGMNIKAEAQTQGDFKASGGPVNVQGMTATFKGSTSAELNGGGMTTISGGLIKIG